MRAFTKLMEAVCIALIALVGTEFGFWRTTIHLGGLRSISIGPAAAFACGIGPSATMTANGQQALSYPQTPSETAATPLGIFVNYFQVGAPIHFTEDLSNLPTPIDISVYKWVWTFGDGSSAGGFQSSHTYTKAGSYAVHLELIDPSNPINSDPSFDSAEITIIPALYSNIPVAIAKSNAEYVTVGGSVTYTAAGSYAKSGNALTYTWNFGDTTTAQGETVTHQFTFGGKGFVALIVQDSRGARAVTTVPIFVVAGLPIAKVSVSSQSISPGDSVTFDASASQPVSPTIVPNDQIATYIWNFGDGTKQITTIPVLTHQYSNPGVYTAILEIVDTSGVPAYAKVTITVSQPGGFLQGSATLYISVAAALLAASAGWWYYRRQKILLARKYAPRRHIR